MEKFRIGLYGITQVTAIVYGVLASGAMFKLMHPLANSDETGHPDFNLGMFYRDHGYFLFLLVILWTVFAAYSSAFSWNRLNEKDITSSGLALTIVYAIWGTFCVFAAAMPQHIIVPNS